MSIQLILISLLVAVPRQYRSTFFGYTMKLQFLRTKSLRGGGTPHVVIVVRRGGFTTPSSYGWGGLPPNSSRYKEGVYPLQPSPGKGVPESCPSIPPPACLFCYFPVAIYATQVYVVAPDCPPVCPLNVVVARWGGSTPSCCMSSSANPS